MLIKKTYLKGRFSAQHFLKKTEGDTDIKYFGTVHAVPFILRRYPSKNRMKKFFKGIANDFSRWNAKMLCRAGIIAALYTVLTWALGSLAYGPFQIRPAEALCVLPLFFPEAVPALYVGCILANAISLYGVYDIFLGSLATLLAAILTYLAGKIIRNNVLKVAVGGFFPIILNAFIVPAVWILAGMPDIVYWVEFGIMILNEALWIYVLGIPLFFVILRLRKRGVSVFTSPVHAMAADGKNQIDPDISHDERQ